MLPDRVSNPGPLTYESGALPIALRGPASQLVRYAKVGMKTLRNTQFRACCKYQDFVDRGQLLIYIFFSQGYRKAKVVSTVKIILWETSRPRRFLQCDCF